MAKMKLTDFALLVAVCAVICRSVGQVYGQMKAGTDAPIADVLPQIFLPEYQQFELSNGIKVYYVENPSLQLLRVRMISRSGADQESIPGLARLTMGVVTKGTASRSAQQIAEELEFLGASLGSSASWDQCAVSLLVLPEFGDAALSVLADVIQHPTFPEGEIDRLRKQLLSDLLQSKFDPGYQASFALAQVLFEPQHPYRHSLNGTLQSLPQIGRDDCQRFYARTFFPNNVFVVAAGPYPVAVFHELVERYFGSWSQSPATKETLEIPPVLFPSENRLGIVDNPQAVQAELMLTLPAPAYTDSLYPAFVLAQTVLSGYFLARLNRVLREEKGYTYGIFGSVTHRRFLHMLVIRTGIGNEVLPKAVQTLYNELQRFGEQPVDSGEQELARRYLLGQIAVRLESVNTILALLATQELYHLPPKFYQHLYQQLRTVGEQQVAEVQRRFFQNLHVAIGVSGSPVVVEKAFTAFPDLHIQHFPMEAVVGAINGDTAK